VDVTNYRYPTAEKVRDFLQRKITVTMHALFEDPSLSKEHDFNVACTTYRQFVIQKNVSLDTLQAMEDDRV
jgi:hypothetical protein